MLEDDLESVAQPFAEIQGRSDVRRFIKYVNRACVEFGGIEPEKLKEISFADRYAIWLRYISSYNRSQSSKRRILALTSETHYSQADVENLWQEQQQCCAYCKEPMLRDGWHVDHIVPLSRGGTNGPENIALACEFCNLSKGSKLLDEWVNRWYE